MAGDRYTGLDICKQQSTAEQSASWCCYFCTFLRTKNAFLLPLPNFAFFRWFHSARCLWAETLLTAPTLMLKSDECSDMLLFWCRNWEGLQFTSAVQRWVRNKKWHVSDLSRCSELNTAVLYASVIERSVCALLMWGVWRNKMLRSYTDRKGSRVSSLRAFER